MQLLKHTYKDTGVLIQLCRFMCLDTGVEMQVKRPTKLTYMMTTTTYIDILKTSLKVVGGCGRYLRNATLCGDRASKFVCGSTQCGEIIYIYIIYVYDVAVPFGFARPRWKVRPLGSVPLGSGKHACVNAACCW